MSIKQQIPNLFTLGNLFCGILASIAVLSNSYTEAAIFVGLGLFLDFFDGAVARLLKVAGELGKQLDSLADMVTFGVVPGLVLYKLIMQNTDNEYLPYIGLWVTLFSAMRLAKFNIDTRQTNSFIGLPTPANTMLIISLPLILEYNNAEWINNFIENEYVLIGLSIITGWLLVAEVPLLSLKFKNLKWKGNEFRFILILGSVILIALFYFIAIPFIILLYLILSLIYNRTLSI